MSIRLVADSEDALLAALPHAVGFIPTDSVVAAAIDGGQIGTMTARVDLPHCAEEVRAMAEGFAPILAHHAHAVLLIGYGPITESARALAALAVALNERGVETPAPIIVTDGSWRHVTCLCCPEQGRPLTENHPLALQAVEAGSAPQTVEQIAQRFEVLPRAERVDAHMRELGRALDLVSLATTWGKLLTPGTVAAELGDEDIALAAEGLRDKVFRDAVIEEIRSQDRLELHRVMECLIDMSALVPDERAVPLLSVLALLAWRAGSGLHARLALERALWIDPNYRLAILITQLVENGIRME